LTLLNTYTIIGVTLVGLSPDPKANLGLVPSVNLNLPGELSMKKLLLVMSMLLVCSLAANAAPVLFNFTLDGYCDYFYTTLYTPNPGVVPKAFISGVHGCDGLPVLPIGGFKHGLSATISGVSGAIYDFSDTESVEWGYGHIGNATWIVSKLYKFWVVYEDTDGNGQYLINYGSLTPFAKVTPQQAGKPAGKR
jgi:hypothetical protein